MTQPPRPFPAPGQRPTAPYMETSATVQQAAPKPEGSRNEGSSSESASAKRAITSAITGGFAILGSIYAGYKGFPKELVPLELSGELAATSVFLAAYDTKELYLEFKHRHEINNREHSFKRGSFMAVAAGLFTVSSVGLGLHIFRGSDDSKTTTGSSMSSVVAHPGGAASFACELPNLIPDNVFSADAVKEQYWLSTLGLYDPKKIDGIQGKKTHTALKTWQGMKEVNLPVTEQTGKWNPAADCDKSVVFADGDSNTPAYTPAVLALISGGGAPTPTTGG